MIITKQPSGLYQATYKGQRAFGYKPHEAIINLLILIQD